MKEVNHKVTRLSVYSVFAYCLSHGLSPEGLTEGHLARSVYNAGETNSVNKKFVHPHIYHLKKNGIISAVGKRLCPITKKLCESYNLTGKLYVIAIQDDKKEKTIILIIIFNKMTLNGLITDLIKIFVLFSTLERLKK